MTNQNENDNPLNPARALKPLTEQDKAEFFKNLIVFKDMKEGDTVTAQMVAAINFFFGPVLRSIKPVAIDISFGKDGKAIVTGEGAELIKSVKNGEDELL